MSTFDLQSSKNEIEEEERNRYKMLVKKSVENKGFCPTLDISFKYVPIKEYGKEKVIELVNKFFDEELKNIDDMWISF